LNHWLKSDMNRVVSETVLVTGGATGEATTRAIVSEGGRVVVADLQAERGGTIAPLASTAGVIGGQGPHV